jgi:signal transduction histidine kinase
LKNGKAKKSKHHDFINFAIVGLIALTWGSTVYPLIAYEHSKMEIMVLNLIFIYGIAGTINLSQHLKTMRIFLICYGTGLTGSVIATMIFTQINHALDNTTIITFMLLFVFMLNKFGTETNKSHINAMRLQYSNQLLIESLTIEKQIAINAVEVKNRIMASATHDMRQPILALDLYTDMLISAPENLHKLVPKISEATKSVITMFDAMFDLARMSMNQLLPTKIKFNLKNIITELELQYLVPAKSKGLQLRVQYKNTEYLMLLSILKLAAYYWFVVIAISMVFEWRFGILVLVFHRLCRRLFFQSFIRTQKTQVPVKVLALVWPLWLSYVCCWGIN